MTDIPSEKIAVVTGPATLTLDIVREPELRIVRSRLFSAECVPCGSGTSAGFPGRGFECLLGGIRGYFSHGAGKLPLDLLDLSGLTPFAMKLLCELRGKVTRGRTVSYGELAGLAGFPGAARAVGSALARNPFPLFFPCHRVLRSDGTPGGFWGRTDSGAADFKRRLLEAEDADVK